MDSIVEIAPSEKHSVDYLGDLYAAIVSIERLEKAHYRDLVSPQQYLQALRRLLDKYNSIVEHLRAAATTASSSSTGVMFNFQDESGSLDQFIAAYCPNCAAAKIRIRQGHPDDIATAKEKMEKEREQEGKGVNPNTVLEAGQHFITLSDCLKLQQNAVDQLLPIITDLIDSVEKLQIQARSSPAAQGLPPEDVEFQFVPKLKIWSGKLEQMHASEELNERDAREMAFDVERGYQALYRQLTALGGGSKPDDAGAARVA